MSVELQSKPVPDWAKSMISNWRARLGGAAAHITDGQIFFALDNGITSMNQEDQEEALRGDLGL